MLLFDEYTLPWRDSEIV
ncbi:unnamed protein product, partial [Acanthoscelides obtectus]